MTWIRLDDQFLDHPKIVGLTSDQLVLWLAGLAYCNRHNTNGAIPLAALERSIAPSRGVPATEAGALVSAGLWEPTPSGFAIHDYAEYQPTREKVDARREQYRESKRRRRSAVHSGHDVESTTCPHDVRDGDDDDDLLISTSPDRSSSSSPSTTCPPWTTRGQAIAQQLRDLAGIEANGTVRTEIEEMLAEGITEGELVEKIKAGARFGAKSWEYIARSIERAAQAPPPASGILDRIAAYHSREVAG